MMSSHAKIVRIEIFAGEIQFKKGFYNHLKVETRLSTKEAWETCKGEHSMQRPIKPYTVVCDKPTNAKYLMISSGGGTTSALALQEVKVQGIHVSLGLGINSFSILARFYPLIVYQVFVSDMLTLIQLGTHPPHFSTFRK